MQGIPKKYINNDSFITSKRKGDWKTLLHESSRQDAMNKKKVIATVTACGLVAAMSVGGALAYLTDNEAHTNVVQMSGNIRIDLVEEHWDTTDTDSDGVPDKAEKVVPNQEISKDPKVINTGENPTFVFLRMTVPVKDVTRVTDNGTLVRKDNSDVAIVDQTTGAKKYHEPQELFFFKRGLTTATNGDAITLHENHFNDGWVRLDRQFNTDTTVAGAYDMNTAVGQAVYVFGWKDVLVPRNETATLYDKIQIKNIIEQEVASDQIQNIRLEAFGIQSDNLIVDGEKFTKKANLTQSELEKIYDIFVQQNGKVEKDLTAGHNGDFIWNTFQDVEHGQTQKEAHTNNERDLNNTDKRNATTIEKVNADSTVLKVGQTSTLKWNYYTPPKDGGTHVPKYTSSNPDVATVAASGAGGNEAIITAKKMGTATITVEVDGAKKSIAVLVTNDSRDQTPDNNVDANDNSIDPNGTNETGTNHTLP
jgi:hypothetical protein